MKILKTAIIGLGRVGWLYHAPAIRAHEGFELIAAVDPLESRRQEAEKEYGISTFSSVDEVLASRPDLVVVASPTAFHRDHTVQMLRAGCDVFCEKPLAASLTDADAMIEESGRTGKKLMVYQPHRTGSDLLALFSILEQQLLGSVYMIKRAWSGFDRRNDWQALRKNGGGMLNNYGAHMIDQMLHLTRSTARHISCVLRTIATAGDADDVVKVVLGTASNVLCDMDINMAAAQPFPQWQVLGTLGSATLDEPAQVWRVRYHHAEPTSALQQGLAAEQRRYGSGEVIDWKEKMIALSEFPPLNFYDKCYEFYGLGQTPFVPLRETREVMRCIAECREDAMGK
jgi:predicted dehydrogenase